MQRELSASSVTPVACHVRSEAYEGHEKPGKPSKSLGVESEQNTHVVHTRYRRRSFPNGSYPPHRGVRSRHSPIPASVPVSHVTSRPHSPPIGGIRRIRYAVAPDRGKEPSDHPQRIRLESILIQSFVRELNRLRDHLPLLRSHGPANWVSG